MGRPFSKRTSQFVLLGLVLLHNLICNNSEVACVQALSFPGGGRSHGGSDPSPHQNNNPIQLCVRLDSDEEDPEHAELCCSRNEMRGGGDETAHKTPPPATTSLSPKAQALLVNPTFTALLKTLASIHFWNDSLQELKLGLNFCHLVRKVVGRGPNEIMQEAPEGIERFADDDGMKQLIGVRKRWFIPDSKGSIGFALARTNTHFERHETSALLNIRPGLGEQWEDGNGRLSCFFAPTLNLGALMRSSEDDVGQQFATFANIAVSASESICLVKQQQRKGVPVFLRFLQKGVLSTMKLPRHVSNLSGHAARVRDYNEMAVFETNGSPFWEYASIPPVSSYFKGSVELQIPSTSILQGSFVMMFGDVSFAHGICRRAGGEEEKTVSRFDNIVRKSCIGAAIYRLPFRFGVSYSENGRAGVTFGFVDSSDY